MLISDDLQYVLDNIPGVVVGRNSKGLNKRDYTESIKEYTEEISPVFNKLQEFINGHPEGRDEIIKMVAETFVKAVRDDAADKTKHRGINARSMAQDDYLLVVVSYMNPGIQNLQLEMGEDFIQTVHEEWVKIWPKQNYQVASEDAISSGFKKKWFEIFTK